MTHTVKRVKGLKFDLHESGNLFFNFSTSETNCGKYLDEGNVKYDGNLILRIFYFKFF